MIEIGFESDLGGGPLKVELRTVHSNLHIVQAPRIACLHEMIV